MNAPIDANEATARKRFMIMNVVRVGSLGGLILGLAIARSVVDAPYFLGVAMAVAGLLGFYFGPRALARKWKSQSENETR